MRFLLAHFCGKLVYLILKILGKNATCLPGTVALFIDKNYLKKIKINACVVAVTGTNGKTSTSNLIYDFLKSANYKVINNSLGSNIESGIATLLLVNCKKQQIDHDYVIMEVDEKSSKHIFTKLVPNYLVITNIFRDSYSRNAHPDYIISILNKSIPDNTTLIINADDLLSCKIKPNNKRIYFSFKKEIPRFEYVSNVVDVVECPNCNCLLNVDYRRYHHIGRYHCSGCGFKSFDGDFELLDIDYFKNTIIIKHHDINYQLPAISLREIDLYNQLAVFSLLMELKINPELIIKNFSQLKIVSSRLNVVNVGNLTIISSLAKGLNPIATSRVFEYIIQENKKCCIILVQSETGFITKGNYDDSNNHISESIGWLYEVDFELLCHECIDKVIVGGKRILDYQVRCELAGIDSNKILLYRNPLQCHEGIDFNSIERVYLLFDIHNQSFADYNIEQIRLRMNKNES